MDIINNDFHLLFFGMIYIYNKELLDNNKELFPQTKIRMLTSWSQVRILLVMLK